MASLLLPDPEDEDWLGGPRGTPPLESELEELSDED